MKVLLGQVQMRAVECCLAIVASFALTAPALAEPFCADLEALANDEGTDTFSLPPPLAPYLATCSRSLALSGAENLHCHWSFPYRDAEATETFTALLANVTLCLGPKATVSTDDRVNHPDAYDLRLLRLGGQEFGVSLKDKGALQQTLIFLRVQLVPPH